MPFEPLVTGIIETSLNRLINDDPQHQKQVSRLKGKVIRVHLQEPNTQFIFVFSHQVDVLSQYEGPLDCDLSFKLAVLPELKGQANITQLIKQDKLQLDGDMQLAQKFSQLLFDIKPDPEEWLSRMTGDVVAHTVVQGAKDHFNWLQSGFQNQQRKLGTVLTQEWQVAPNGLEVASFCDQVNDAANQCSQIEQRIKRLVADL